MTDTHKPLSAAKVKELMEWLDERIGKINGFYKLSKADGYVFIGENYTTALQAFSLTKTKLQSPINEAEDE